MSCDYILHLWPKRLTDQTRKAFQTDYEQRLKKKSLEKTRGLFLFELEGNIVDLGNVYIDDKQRLNIAEFYIIPEQRKKGLGSHFFNLLKAWGKSKNATSIRAEVDKHLENANAFWKSQGLTLTSSEKRNVYTGDLDN